MVVAPDSSSARTGAEARNFHHDRISLTRSYRTRMHESALILTLTGSLAAALALGYITQRLGLSPIVGYLLAGLIVGPYTPGFVANRAVANEFAEIGVVLLMFGVGLQFHLKDLLAFRNV